MKIHTIRILITLFFLIAGGVALAQDKIIILVRHVEKDVSATADKTDPELAQAGRERARLLIEKIGKYKPDAIYSTRYKRTLDSVKPISKRLLRQNIP